MLAVGYLNPLLIKHCLHVGGPGDGLAGGAVEAGEFEVAGGDQQALVAFGHRHFAVDGAGALGEFNNRRFDSIFLIGHQGANKVHSHFGGDKCDWQLADRAQIQAQLLAHAVKTVVNKVADVVLGADVTVGINFGKTRPGLADEENWLATHFIPPMQRNISGPGTAVHRAKNGS